MWLIRDLYALESDLRFPRKETDFYFDDVSTPGSYPVPATNAMGSFPDLGITLPPAPSRPKDFQTMPRQGDNENKGTKTINDNDSETKTNENDSTSKEKNVKELLKDFVSLLLNLNNKKDSLIHQLTSYLGNENDPPKNVSEHVEAPSTMRNTQLKMNLTTPATTTLNDTDEDDGDNDSEEDDDYTSESPQITITNTLLNNNTNVTPNPGQYVNESQARTPAVNNYKPMGIFQYQEEMGIIPNNEFMDDVINSPKNTPKNKGENPKNSTKPSKIKEKPSNQSSIDENASNSGNENRPKHPISMEKSGLNEGSYDKNDNQFPQVQISSEEPLNLNPISTQRSYQIPLIPEAKLNFQNQEEDEDTGNPLPIHQNLESQISDPYPVYHQDFYPKPIAFISRRSNYDRKPTYNYEPVPNMHNHIFRPSPQLFPKIISLPIKSYNQQHANDYDAPRMVYPQELQSQGNQPQSDISSGTVPFIPKYLNDPNAAISNYDTINPVNTEKKEDKMPVDGILSAFSLKNDSNPSDGLHLDKNSQLSKNMSLLQTKNIMNDTTPYNKLSVQNNSTDDSVSKESENANLASTEFALLLNNTEIEKEQNVSTTEASFQPQKNNSYSTEIPVPQKKASPFQSKLITIKPFLIRNRFRKPIQQNKLNSSTPLKENKMYSELELPPENKLNNSEVSPENKLNDSELSPEKEENSPTESPNNQQINTEGLVPQNSLTEIVSTSETPLSSEPSLKNPRNISLPLDSKQSTDDAPEVESQSTTLPDDSKETDSEESDNYDVSRKEESSDDTDDDEQDNTDDEEQENTDDEEQDNTDDGYESDNEDTMHGNSDDEDAFLNMNDADGSNDSDKGVKNILNVSDKVLINNARSDKPQNSSILILASTESPQTQTSDLNKSSRNRPVPSVDDVNKNPQNLSTPSPNDTNESPRNPPVTPTDDFNKSSHSPPLPSTDDKSPENCLVPSMDESNESPEKCESPPVSPTDDFKNSPQNFPVPITNHTTESPMNMDNANKNSKHHGSKGPPYDNILDYIYSYSKKPFSEELKEQQDKM